MLALMASRNAGEVISLVQDNKVLPSLATLIVYYLTAPQWPTVSWAPFGLCGPQISTSSMSPKRTVGFLGFGRISQATLARLIPFGITDCLYTSNPNSTPTPSRDEDFAKRHGLSSLRRVDVNDLARKSDILFVLAPGGPLTRHLVNEEFLKKMKKTSVLVNTSRGTLVDSDALAKALREKWIWGAGLDVVEGEPNVTAEHPLVKEPRCIVLPHVGSGTFETRLGMATLAVQNLLAGIDGGDSHMPAALDLTNKL
ncbi:hypothetical protein DXG03_009493 [Asterophora parasitica]|uniref:D-isomer specific 2-hydroxyacid dehydrogenase NAD-binding domain-containing protein n=1 Tax=Asterophora parasitica TaxID=117018 RepID=A0A9P7KDJ2_9AGAR|nr:hypothetical protein DXG03_009493 [Asterophora parasitica]